VNLREMPQEERPRERLLSQGADALSLPELIAILLTTGTKGKSVLDLAHEIVARFGSLQGLLEASVSELTEIRGLGFAKAIQLKAAFGIALKASRTPHNAKMPVGAKEAYYLVRDDLEYSRKEIMAVVMKDIKGRLIGREVVSIGTLSQVLAHPREIFRPAVRHSASSMILAHNHPSGDPTPSDADLELTKHLIRSSRIMGIGLDDHLIIGQNRFISMREMGLMSDKVQKTEPLST